MLCNTCVCAAQPFGIVVGLAAAGALAGSSGGWPSVFYVTGALGMIVGIWILLGVAECPAQHPSMSPKERAYIEENFGVAPSTDHVSVDRGHMVDISLAVTLIRSSCMTILAFTLQKRPTPWTSILTSIPMISLVLAHCGHSWAFWTILTKMPTYLDKALNYNIQEVAIS